MWVEATNPSVWRVNERIAVVYDQNSDTMEGFYRTTEFNTDGYTVFFVTLGGREMSASHSRKFYKWVEDEPNDSHNRLDVHVDQSALRLHNPERAKKLHEHVGNIIKEQTTRCDVQVGRQTYVLAPGDHLRVWWEDGHLWTELVQSG